MYMTISDKNTEVGLKKLVSSYESLLKRMGFSEAEIRYKLDTANDRLSRHKYRTRDNTNKTISRGETMIKGLMNSNSR
jgi:hypothetical protein